MNLRDLMFIFIGLLLGFIGTGYYFEGVAEAQDKELEAAKSVTKGMRASGPNKCPYVNIKCNTGPWCDGCENERYDH